MVGAMSELARKQLLEQIEKLIEAKDSIVLRELLSDSRSADVAEVVEVLDEAARQILFDLLEPKEAGEVLEKIDDATRSEMVDELTGDALRDIVATLPPDEAADVVADLSEEKSGQVLDQIEKADSDQISKLMRYDEDSAGGIMTPVMVKVQLTDTIDQAIGVIRRVDPEEEYFHVFVIDEKGVFQGSVNFHTLLRCAAETKIADVLDEKLPTVSVDADQEDIANTFRKNDLVVMPVVNERGVLLGRITFDDVIDVMEEEAEEDALVMAGTRPAEMETHNALKVAAIRLPWLLTCMIGALLSAILFYPLFEALFKERHGLNIWNYIVIFIPAIAAMGGNSGMQTSTVVVRGFATGDLAGLDIATIFARESRIALVVATTCAFIAGGIAVGFLRLQTNANFGFILGVSVGVAMFFAILISMLLGLFLPYGFRKIGVDPAISAGPLVTTINDIISFVTYFALALAMLKIFGG
jgi:magnesium transporter